MGPTKDGEATLCRVLLQPDAGEEEEDDDDGEDWSDTDEEARQDEEPEPEPEPEPMFDLGVLRQELEVLATVVAVDGDDAVEQEGASVARLTERAKVLGVSDEAVAIALVTAQTTEQPPEPEPEPEAGEAGRGKKKKKKGKKAAKDTADAQAEPEPEPDEPEPVPLTPEATLIELIVSTVDARQTARSAAAKAMCERYKPKAKAASKDSSLADEDMYAEALQLMAGGQWVQAEVALREALWEDGVEEQSEEEPEISIGEPYLEVPLCMCCNHSGLLVENAQKRLLSAADVVMLVTAGWCEYKTAPQPAKGKKKAKPGAACFAPRRFVLTLAPDGSSVVGMTTFFEGPAEFEITECSCAAMYPALSTWDERLRQALDVGIASGMDEGHKLCRRAKTLRSVRTAWLEIASAEWEQRLAVQRALEEAAAAKEAAKLAKAEAKKAKKKNGKASPPPPPPEPDPEPEPTALFSVEIYLDAIGTYESIHWYEGTESPEAAAAAFVAKHGLAPGQLQPTVDAVAQQLELYRNPPASPEPEPEPEPEQG
eukprot:COSAG05_NODE_782_length_7373_cov_4.015122_2_plen_541_part_00